MERARDVRLDRAAAGARLDLRLRRAAIAHGSFGARRRAWSRRRSSAAASSEFEPFAAGRQLTLGQVSWSSLALGLSWRLLQKPANRAEHLVAIADEDPVVPAVDLEDAAVRHLVLELHARRPLRLSVPRIICCSPAACCAIASLPRLELRDGVRHRVDRQRRRAHRAVVADARRRSSCRRA